MLIRCLLVLINSCLIIASNEDACQSGLREDNTNYIYCARQNLTKIPKFHSSNEKHDTIVSNLVYDELVLSDNLISKIDAFSLLKAKKIYVDQNPIREIHPNSFEHVKSYLEEIYFENKKPIQNDLYHMNNLNTNYDYEEAHLSGSDDDGQIFEAALLSKCSNLRLLSIKSYDFFHLKKFLFQKLIRLEILILNSNRLKSIDKNAFIGLEHSLVELNLASNLLEQVPTESLAVFRKLKRLNLSQNRIKILESNSFFTLRSALHSLDLSYNFIQDIDLSAFNGQIQNNLKTLLIQNNELNWSNFVYLLFNLYQLNELNADFNKLGSRNSPQIQNLSSCDDASFIDLKLTHLSLQGNALSEENLQLFTHSYSYNPNILLFNNHKFKKFKYSSLQRLNLARNKIKKIPEKFFNMLCMLELTELILDRNPLGFSAADLSQFLGIENSLLNLNLNNLNPIGFINKANLFSSLNILHSLRNLELSNNNNYEENLSVLNAEPELRLSNLESLKMANNNLEKAPKFLCQMKNLTKLDLSSNFIQTFDVACLFDGNKLKQLNLNQNPLNCDCKMKDLKRWLVRNSEFSLSKNDFSIEEFIKWKCVEPSELANKYFTSIHLNELKCVTETHEKPFMVVEYSTFDTFTAFFSTLTTRNTTRITATKHTPSKSLLTTRFGSLSNQTLAQFYINKVDLNYYSLIIGVSLGVSTVCLIILLFLYVNCVRNSSGSKLDSSKLTLEYSDYLNHHVKHSNQSNLVNSLFFSSPFSSNTSVTTITNAKSSGSVSSYNDLLLKLSQTNGSSLHQISNQSLANNKKELDLIERENSVYNNLNYEEPLSAAERVYSIPSANGFNHIYHEINQYNNLSNSFLIQNCSKNNHGNTTNEENFQYYLSKNLNKTNLNNSNQNSHRLYHHQQYYYTHYNQNTNDFSKSLIV